MVSHRHHHTVHAAIEHDKHVAVEAKVSEKSEAEAKLKAHVAEVAEIRTLLEVVSICSPSSLACTSHVTEKRAKVALVGCYQKQCSDNHLNNDL